MKRQEKGFALIDLAVSIAIAAIITAGAGMTTVQIIKGTERNENHATVIRQAHNLGRWFSRDALTAANVTAGDDPETADSELMTIFWKDWESADIYNISYIWLEGSDSLWQIKRREVMRDMDGAVVNNTTTLIANGIYSANLTQQDDTWILDIETRSGQDSSALEFKVAKRLD